MDYPVHAAMMAHSDGRAVNIEHPTHHDVLCGRGVTTNRHPGNESFRKLVSVNKELYVSSTKSEKMKISRSIVKAVQSLDPPGRFLDKDPRTNLWFEVEQKKAIEKTSQALRDGASSLRKQLAADLDDPNYLKGVFDSDDAKPTNDGNSDKDDKEKTAIVITNKTDSVGKPAASDKPKTPKSKTLAKKDQKKTKQIPCSATAGKSKLQRRNRAWSEPASPRVRSGDYPRGLSPRPPPSPRSPMVWGPRHLSHDNYGYSPRRVVPTLPSPRPGYEPPTSSSPSPYYDRSPHSSSNGGESASYTSRPGLDYYHNYHSQSHSYHSSAQPPPTPPPYHGPHRQHISYAYPNRHTHAYSHPHEHDGGSSGYDHPGPQSHVPPHSPHPSAVSAVPTPSSVVSQPRTSPSPSLAGTSSSHLHSPHAHSQPPRPAHDHSYAHPQQHPPENSPYPTYARSENPTNAVAAAATSSPEHPQNYPSEHPPEVSVSVHHHQHHRHHHPSYHPGYGPARYSPESPSYDGPTHPPTPVHHVPPPTPPPPPSPIAGARHPSSAPLPPRSSLPPRAPSYHERHHFTPDSHHTRSQCPEWSPRSVHQQRGGIRYSYVEEQRPATWAGTRQTRSYSMDAEETASNSLAVPCLGGEGVINSPALMPRVPLAPRSRSRQYRSELPPPPPRPAQVQLGTTRGDFTPPRIPSRYDLHHHIYRSNSYDETVHRSSAYRRSSTEKEDEKKTEDGSDEDVRNSRAVTLARGSPKDVKSLKLSQKVKMEATDSYSGEETSVFRAGSMAAHFFVQRDVGNETNPNDAGGAMKKEVDDMSMSPLHISFDNEDPSTLMNLPEDIMQMPISPCGPNDDPVVAESRK